MTAINALILPDETHVFADAGRFIAGTTIIKNVARKIWKLGDRHVFLFCGEDHDGDRLRDYLLQIPPERVRMGFAELVRTFPMMRPDPFTAFLFGPGYGMAVEESGKAHSLSPDRGNQVRTISSNLNLDPSRLRDSAIELMADQRRTSRVVAGWMDWARVRADGVSIETVCLWESAIG